MERMNKILFLITFGWLTVACDSIHRFPDQDSVDPYLVDVDIEIAVDMSIEQELSPQTYATYSSMLDGDYDIRDIVEIYKDAESKATDLSQRVARIVQTSDELSTDGKFKISQRVRIPVQKYKVLVWVDFVKKNGNQDLYYQTKRLTSVSILKPEGAYVGYNTTKDAFCGSSPMNLTPFEGQRFVKYKLDCPVERPFAVYQLITTDVEKYMTYYKPLSSYASIRPSTTNLRYQLYFPLGYNVQFGVPGQYAANVGYKFDITDVAPKREAILASDFVFVSEDTYFNVDFEVKNAQNEHINTIENLKINLKKNSMTVIRGEFLTKDLNNGGIGVDDEFEEEIIVKID